MARSRVFRASRPENLYRMSQSLPRRIRGAFAESLRLRVLALMMVVFVAIAAPAAYIFVHIVDATVLRLGTLFAEKQILYDRYRGLETLMREVGLAETLARSPSILEWAADEENAQKRARGIAELEHFRTAFKDRSYFFVINGSGNYYYNDARNGYAGNQYRYTISQSNPRDGWYYATAAEGPGCQLNVDHDDVLLVTKVWINCVITDKGRTLGIIGTGLDLSTFIHEVVNGEQRGVESFFVDRSGAIQASRDAGKIDFHSLTKEAESKKTVFRTIDSAADRAKLSDMFERVSSGEADVAAEFLTISGKRMLAGVGWLDRLGWYNVTLMDVDAVIDRRMFWPMAALFGLAMLAAAVLVTWMFRRSVLDRLAAMEGDLGRIEGGNFAVETSDRGRDEISRLSRALSTMARTVRENTGNLERAVSERTRQLEQIAFVDPLTGVANRRGFARDYEQVLEAARRTRELPGLLLVDIDRFKQINDRFGHKAGDEVVTEFARRIASVLRPGDVCGRWGGDEFIVLFADCDGVLLRQLGDRVLEAIRGQDFSGARETPLPITPSIGAHLVRPGETLDAATHKADIALYAAKDKGRNCIVMYEPSLQVASRVA